MGLEGVTMDWDKGGLARVGQESTQMGKEQCAKYDQVLGSMATFQAASLVFSTGGLAPPGTA